MKKCLTCGDCVLRFGLEKESGPMDHNHQGTMKRPSQGPYMHPSYSFQGQYGSQYSQRYAPVSQVRPSPMGMAGQNYPQQNFQQQHHHQQQQPPPSQQQSQGNRPQSSTLTPSKEGHNETLVGVSLKSCLLFHAV
uniref:Uncharacterized protein n=1 Tax=Strigamia maritima TaxID=126957 RepID=T1IR60_STRMM